MAFSVGNKNGRELRIHENAVELSNNLAEYIAELSEASIKERGVFAIALSGGSLITLMGKLCEAPYNKTVDWGKWYIFWTDERVVAKSHADSNYKLAKDSLFSKYIAELSEASIKERGVFAIALSGGSLITLMGKLCEAPYNKTVDWGKWYIFWTDERVVAKSHADSNYKLAKDSLFSKVPIMHSHMHSINDSVTSEQAAEDYEFVIRQLVRTRVINVSEVFDCPKFDLVLLGMGPDGNIASLFPNHAALQERELWVTFITDSPKPPPERITFTMPVINSASNVAVVVTGVGKAEAAHLAIDNTGPESPARMVSPINGKLVWFLDIEAASKLEGIKFSEWS